MAGRIRGEDIELVRERARIDEVVRDYVSLRSAGGGSLKGLCPFHDERSPSFQVTPSRGFYYCFGCGEGGDVLTFVQKMDHATFVEAVEKLAARYGVTLRYEEGGAAPIRQQGQRTRLIDAHKHAAAFYAEQLATPEAEIGRRFLSERGFDRRGLVALRRRLRADRLGQPDHPAARHGVHRRGAAERRAGGRRAARVVRPLPGPAGVADPRPVGRRDRLRGPQAAARTTTDRST